MGYLNSRHFVDRASHFVDRASHFVDRASIKWATTRENMSSGVSEQHRRRPACASVQSDQPLCYLLFGKYYMGTCYR